MWILRATTLWILRATVRTYDACNEPNQGTPASSQGNPSIEPGEPQHRASRESNFLESDKVAEQGLNGQFYSDTMA
eukprot:9482993-Pyramimonas_sp.AAC.1